MSYVIGVIQTVLPVLFVLGLGVICRRGNIFSREGVDTLKSAAINIALPAVLLKAFATTSYSLKNIIVPVVIFAICMIAWLIGKACNTVFHLQDKYVSFLTTGFEVGMLGYTFFGMLFKESMATLALLDLGQVLFTFTVYKILVVKETSEKGKDLNIVRSLLTSPIIISITVGVLIGATGMYGWMEHAGVNGIFDTLVDFVAAPTGVLILLSIGYDLILKDIKWGKVVKVVLIRAVVMTVSAFAAFLILRNVLEDAVMLRHAVCVLFILPPPYALPIFADDKENSAFLSSALTVFTLISIVCFGVLACVA